MFLKKTSLPMSWWKACLSRKAVCSEDMHTGPKWKQRQAIYGNRFCAEQFGLLASFQFEVLTSHSPSPI